MPTSLLSDELDDLNRRVGEMVLDDGRVNFGTTVCDGKIAFRPAIVNWRTREEDVDLIVSTVRELGARAIAQARAASSQASTATEAVEAEPAEVVEPPR